MRTCYVIIPLHYQFRLSQQQLDEASDFAYRTQRAERHSLNKQRNLLFCLSTSGHSELQYQGLHCKQCSVAPETARKLTGQLDIQPGWTSNWQWIHFWYYLCFGDYLQIALCIGWLQIVIWTSVSIGCKYAIYNDNFIINRNHGFTHLIIL